MVSKIIVEEEHCLITVDYDEDFIVITQKATGMGINTLTLKKDEFLKIVSLTTDFTKKTKGDF